MDFLGLSYEEKVRKAFFTRGLIIPATLPLKEIASFCQRNCEKYCYGLEGMIIAENIDIRIICGGPQKNIDQKTIDEMIKYFISQQREKIFF